MFIKCTKSLKLWTNGRTSIDFLFITVILEYTRIIYSRYNIFIFIRHLFIRKVNMNNILHLNSTIMSASITAPSTSRGTNGNPRRFMNIRKRFISCNETRETVDFEGEINPYQFDDLLLIPKKHSEST